MPLHQSPAIRSTLMERFNIDPAQTRLPNTEWAAEHTLWLLQNVFLGSQEDMDDIVRAAVKVQKAWR